MKLDFPAILVALHKLIPGILFLVYASEVQHLDDHVTGHPHECTGDTDALHDALVGRSSLAMLSVGTGLSLLVDFLVFAIRFGVVKKEGLRGKLEAMNHLFEFFTAAMGAAVLHTIAQSEDGLAVQALYAGAGCGGDYDAEMKGGVTLVAVAYALVCLEFFIVRVQGLALIPWVGKRAQAFFEDVTGQVGGCDLRKTSAAGSRFNEGEKYPIMGYKDDDV